MTKTTLIGAFVLLGSIAFGQAIPILASEKLIDDFRMLSTALEEAHTGLFWYRSQEEYLAHKSSILADLERSDSLSELEFYNVIAPLIASIKEDHCDISLSDQTSSFLKREGSFFPFLVKFIGQRAYLYHPIDTISPDLNGSEILEINGRDIEEILTRLFTTFAADGDIMSSKYRWLDDIGFAVHYARSIHWKPEGFQLKIQRMDADESEIVSIQPIAFKKLVERKRLLFKQDEKEQLPISFCIQEDIGLLTVSTFSSSEFRKAGIKYERFIKQVFTEIKQKKLKVLLIDVRANGGGTEGNEDFLFSYLTNKSYSKYRFVEINQINYSFLTYTDYSKPRDQKQFERLLRKEFEYHPMSGKYRRKPKIERPEPPQENPFLGKLIVLAGGVTYSGGAEFCSLVREYREDALFVGEEVGGGYYGNTSGYSLTLTLPHSKIQVEVPLIRYVLDVDGQAEGTGVLPDFPIETPIEDFLSGRDRPLEVAFDLAKIPID